ncbi:beta-propeller fold lactonase family protein [Clostridium sp. KNHs205]|uniref:lactonase family protein n=1 Tax=Clostridium sp. KNHs205 TaxID=1449050 RepID=UPI00051AE786|nr:beta-propeller fold lactonase family protein [Clostridium sp. KNHs205]
MNQKARELLISGYGPVNGEASMGLYELSGDFTEDNRSFRAYKSNPSFACTWKDMLFTVREETDSGSILCYKRTEEGYSLQHELQLSGGDLCHLLYAPKESVLYCSFYSSGDIAAVKVQDYHFTEVLNHIKLPVNQETGLSRAHCCEKEPQGSRLLFAAIAQDKIFVYDTDEGRITAESPQTFVNLDKGAGPRHLKFHPVLNCLYVITEYSNEIYVYLYEEKDIVPLFTLLQKLSTLEEQFEGESFGSSLAISSDGRFLYAANRGADTIRVYDINPDGTLAVKQDASVKGEVPRHIALTKDDRYLMIANQKSDQIVIYGVEETGKLLNVVKRIDFPTPSYVEEI